MSVLRCLRALAIVLAFGLAFPSAADTVEDAKAANKRGDYAAELRIWSGLAEQGNAEAQAGLGIMYADGRGVAKDPTAAVQWFRKSAEQGFARGQNGLGLMYENGRGVANDDSAAVQWYRKAADQGYAAAQVNLGRMLQNGRGVAKDDVEAAQWYRKAAEQGYAWGQNNLGVMYRDSRGVAKDDAAAVDWFRKAAEQGNSAAQTSLGYMYELGRGVAGDHTEAMQWYRKAAEKGHAIAQTNLGNMYRDGRGVPRDQAVALQWYRKAAEQGDTRAQNILGSIEKQKRDVADLTTTIAALVKKYEAAQPAATAPDAERAALARAIVDVTDTRDVLTMLLSPERFTEAITPGSEASKLSPRFRDAISASAVASFRAERILTTLERGLAEILDSATLRVGLQWERSGLGRNIRRFEIDAEKPEQRTAKQEFIREFVTKAGSANDARARACAQKNILDNSADAMLPFLEAMIAAGGMAANAQQGQPLDLDAIQRIVVALRPVLRDTANQAVLADCMYSFRQLTSTDFDQWLEFLRTESGGRYARGSNAAMRTAMLEVAEVFTRTLVDVARQLKGSGES